MEPRGSSFYEISQVRIEWAAISFSRGSSQRRGWTWVSALQDDALLYEAQGKE